MRPLKPCLGTLKTSNNAVPLFEVPRHRVTRDVHWNAGGMTRRSLPCATLVGIQAAGSISRNELRASIGARSCLDRAVARRCA